VRAGRTAPPLPQPDNPLRGIALSACACPGFSIADTTSKFLSTSLPIIEIQWMKPARGRRPLDPGQRARPFEIYPLGQEMRGADTVVDRFQLAPLIP